MWGSQPRPKCRQTVLLADPKWRRKKERKGAPELQSPREGPWLPSMTEKWDGGPGASCSGLHSSTSGPWASSTPLLGAAGLWGLSQGLPGVWCLGYLDRRSGAWRLSFYPRLHLSFPKTILGESIHRAGHTPSVCGCCLLAVMGAKKWAFQTLLSSLEEAPYFPIPAFILFLFFLL